MSTKTVLIAHRQAAVRDRFAVALADARHGCVLTDSEDAAMEAAAHQPFDLAVVDLGLSATPVAFVRRLAGRAVPVMVFSGSVPTAAEIPPLAALNVSYVNEYASTAQILPALAPRLFPDSFNRRVNVRAAIGVPVTYRAGDLVAGAVTLDLGRGGVAIRTMTPLAKGTPIQVRFRLPGVPQEIDASGLVAWSDIRVGMGVQFDRVSATDQRTIEGFVEAQTR
ncbi:MAG: PilZ domain-containing protein [Acidobacteria bacterium]|nr:PilZ domain-containing protein [Acidobacteriota bacterium]